MSHSLQPYGLYPKATQVVDLPTVPVEWVQLELHPVQHGTLSDRAYAWSQQFSCP